MALERFPPGEIVLGPTPFRPETITELDRLLTAGRCPQGRLEIEAGQTRLTCLIYSSAPLLAGLLGRDVYSQVPLYDVAVRARQLEDGICTLIRTDKSQLLMVAVHFCSRPSLQASTRLVDPAHVLGTLESAREDAAIAIVRGGVRSLLFLKGGRPTRLFFGNPEDDPQDGSLEDRFLLYAFSPTELDTTIEVFTDLSFVTDPDPDAGKSLVELAAFTRPAPAVWVFVRLADGSDVRRRPFTPPTMIIGRDQVSDIFIDDLAVSRRHASLSWERGAFVVRDLGSRNGTKVNGKACSKATFELGDRVKIAQFEITMLESRHLEEEPTTLHG